MSLVSLAACINYFPLRFDLLTCGDVLLPLGLLLGPPGVVVVVGVLVLGPRADGLVVV